MLQMVMQRLVATSLYDTHIVYVAMKISSKSKRFRVTTCDVIAIADLKTVVQNKLNQATIDHIIQQLGALAQFDSEKSDPSKSDQSCDKLPCARCFYLCFYLTSVDDTESRVFPGMNAYPIDARMIAALPLGKPFDLQYFLKIINLYV
jgi:hypothetical protein